jgi:hypothetical protein
MARKRTRKRLLSDRAQLLGALRDYERGKIPPLPEIELASLIDGIQRRLNDIETSLDAAER